MKYGTLVFAPRKDFVIILREIDTGILRLFTTQLEHYIASWIHIVEARFVVSFVEPAQGPNHIHRFIRGKISVSGIGCAKVKFLRPVYNERLFKKKTHAWLRDSHEISVRLYVMVLMPSSLTAV